MEILQPIVLCLFKEPVSESHILLPVIQDYIVLSLP